MHTNLKGIWRRSPVLLAAFGLCSSLAGGAVAQNASFSATSTLITGGATSTAAASVTLPPNMFFDGIQSYNTVYGTAGANQVITGLQLNPGTATVVPPNATFSRSAAQALRNATTGGFTGDLEAVSAIIRAGAGSDGLD